MIAEKMGNKHSKSNYFPSFLPEDISRLWLKAQTAGTQADPESLPDLIRQRKEPRQAECDGQNCRKIYQIEDYYTGGEPQISSGNPFKNSVTY